MDELINSENITLEYNERDDNFRLTLFDENSHFLEEIYLSRSHMRDLLNGSKNIDENLIKDNLFL